MTKIREVYISYSRRADYSFIKRLLKASGNALEFSRAAKAGQQLVKEKLGPASEGETGIDKNNFIYDENGCDVGSSIESFMGRLTESPRILILLSPKYFHSPFCVHELISIHNKRAGELFPVVVFTDGCNPSELNRKRILEFWHERATQGISDGEKKLAKRFALSLGPALVWLLGPYDEEFAYHPTKHILASSPDSIADVAQALRTSFSPRFRFVSVREREAILARKLCDLGNKIQKISSEDFKDFAVEICGADCNNVQFFAEGCSTRELLPLLRSTARWLREKIGPTPASMEIQGCCGPLKSLVGWLLLRAVDQEKLMIAFHLLNLEQEDGCLQLERGNDILYQIFTSALVALPVRFNLTASGLRGEGEIDLLESGADRKNLYKLIENNQFSTVWRQVYTDLHRKAYGTDSAALSMRSESDLQGATQELIETLRDEEQAALHLPFDSDKTTNHDKKFRKEFNFRFPQILLIDQTRTAVELNGDIVGTKEPGEGGRLFEAINRIYQNIHKVVHGEQIIA